MEWQPIETAPKDGTWILVIDPDSPMAWAPYGFAAWLFADYKGHYYWAEEDTSEEIFPTHWMPLPPPPTT